MKVIKRNGEIQNFNFSKIENAVNSAFNACGKNQMPMDFLQSLIHLFGIVDIVIVEDE